MKYELQMKGKYIIFFSKSKINFERTGGNPLPSIIFYLMQKSWFLFLTNAYY